MVPVDANVTRAVKIICENSRRIGASPSTLVRFLGEDLTIGENRELIANATARKCNIVPSTVTSVKIVSS
jgi:hypothetical protein